ncbi:MAG: leucine-rich repeat domain-containing protein [Holosporales bacterium]|jgi:hypothetical protein|nr:leucine-rich repeat domain-containing protein [Holosporales bacterium]
MQINKKDTNKKFCSKIINAICQILFILTITNAAAARNHSRHRSNVNQNNFIVGLVEDGVRYLIFDNPEQNNPEQNYKAAALIEAQTGERGLFLRDSFCHQGIVFYTEAVVPSSIVRHVCYIGQPPHYSRPMCCIAMSVKVIEKDAFAFCQLPSGLAFEYGSKLSILKERCLSFVITPSLYIPNGVIIKDAALTGACISLITVDNIDALGHRPEGRLEGSTLPKNLLENATFDRLNIDDVSVLGMSCFKDCKSPYLTRFINKAPITRVECRAFDSAGIKKFVAKPELSLLCAYAFNSSSIKKVDLSRALHVTIEREAFMYCWQLSRVVLPPNIVSISRHLFILCTSLTSIPIPDSVRSFQAGCFMGSGLDEMILPPHILSIDKEALAGTNIQELLIPPSVLDIGMCAMHGIPVVRFACSNETRYFRDMFSVNSFYLQDSPRFRNIPCVREVHNAFFVTEVPVCDLMTEKQFSDFATENRLDGDRTFNSSALIRWSLKDYILYPFINEERLLLQIAPTTYKVYVCVPGKNDQDLFKCLRDGKPYIRREGSMPVSQRIAEQSELAQMQVEYALQHI